MKDKGHVLVVEDDADIREAIAMTLEDEGYGVLTAADGQQALDRLKTAARPIVILLDLMMPGMDGFQFREEQLREPAFASIPVVLLSAGRDLLAKALIFGSAYLSKPVDARALLETVAQYGA